MARLWLAFLLLLSCCDAFISRGMVTRRCAVTRWQRHDRRRVAAVSADVDGDDAEGAGAGAGAAGAADGVTEAEANETETDSDSTALEEDPQQQQVKELELKLASQVADLESALRSERANLARVKDQVSEAGKNGFFIVQAQVAEFLKKNEAQQKQQVNRNKREFVIKMLDVVRKAANPAHFPISWAPQSTAHTF